MIVVFICGGNIKVFKIKIHDVDFRAFYMSRDCHSLNLVIFDMSHSCAKSKSRFRVCQALYNVFVNFTKRCNILLEYADDLTLKSLYVTRWESRIVSVKVIELKLLKQEMH